MMGVINGTIGVVSESINTTNLESTMIGSAEDAELKKQVFNVNT